MSLVRRSEYMWRHMVQSFWQQLLWIRVGPTLISRISGLLYERECGWNSCVATWAIMKHNNCMYCLGPIYFSHSCCISSVSKVYHEDFLSLLFYRDLCFLLCLLLLRLTQWQENEGYTRFAVSDKKRVGSRWEMWKCDEKLKFVQVNFMIFNWSCECESEREKIYYFTVFS